MNLQSSVQSTLQEELKNNNKQPALIPVDDANANEILAEHIHMEEGTREDGSALPPLVSQTVSQSESQENMIIWTPDSPCESTGLAEFELLECQELEAFLLEGGNDTSQTGKTEAAMKGILMDRWPISKNYTTDMTNAERDKNDNPSVHRTRMGKSTQDLTATVSQSADRGLKATRSGSENNVFVSCLSTVPNLSASFASALDTVGCSHPLGSQYMNPTSAKSQLPAPAISSSSSGRKSREQSFERDQIHSSMQLRQVDHTQHSDSHPAIIGNINKKFSTNRPATGDMKFSQVNAGWDMESGASTEVKRYFGDRVPPCRRQLVRPFSPETEPGQPNSNRSSSSSPAPRPQHKANGQRPVHKVVLDASSSSFSSGFGSGTTPASSRGASLERRTRRSSGSPARPATPPSPRVTGSPQKYPSVSPPNLLNVRTPQPGYNNSHPQGYPSGLRFPVKTNLSTSIPKPLLQHPPNERSPPKCPPKPKTVRPKIITYIRKSPQVKAQSLESGGYQVSSLPSRLNTYTSESRSGEDPRTAPVLSASNLLFDKYRQEMQKAHLFSTGQAMSGIKPPCHTMPHKPTGRSDSFYGSLNNKYMPAGMGRSPTSLGGSSNTTEPQKVTQESGPVVRPQRGLRPQLGLGAINRAPSMKNRAFVTGQSSSTALNHPSVQAVSPAPKSIQDSHAAYLEQKKPIPAPAPAPRSLLPKPAPSGLRPPGFSCLPPSRLATFGFVRSSSVSSVSSNHSTDSTRSDPCRPAYRPNSEDPPLHRVVAQVSGDGVRHSLQPPATPALARRSLLPPPRASPSLSRKEFQKNTEITQPALSSPKRLAVVSPKPQSPAHSRQKAVVLARTAVRSVSSERCSPDKERRGQEDIQQLQGRCEEQARQLDLLRAELKKTSLGLDALVICTQHFCFKSESASEKELQLSQELSRIRDEVAFNTARWEYLQKEKVELEISFEQELKELQVQQEAELAALETELRRCHSAEKEHLKAEHQSEVEELRTQQQEQVEELSLHHDSAMSELKIMQDLTLATLQEEHARTMRDLRKAHEQQKISLEEGFEKLRLSLQDQVDTLTFQNRALKDKASRFEEALRKSTDEQIVDALAPYQHIEEDLKSLKEVLQMKNQQIHDQEKKISELEKMALKNVVLEERVQVLQQQNEDLKARIDHNLTVSRQLSEENANLQECVEKESNEKKRLSRNNEELLWRLQTGELSPHMSPSSSPSHRGFFPGPDIPPYTCSPGPGTPTHASSTPVTPTHRVVSPGTPTHRGSVGRASPARFNTLPR
ncbi:microtubule-associated tumor suppressor candidate 2 isoform X2 [Denticeps clupeoides]|uniref:microtubule-associated tumor suppressor candidate 2 isoform X2 n=1 Tax=Denticeps clupeoides TaxID=299321 RepID=UPI0010A3FC8B|nr:microtubule-associated tumor suppressor candidate 2-like isoform X2 [Denticeps clupeoides]